MMVDPSGYWPKWLKKAAKKTSNWVSGAYADTSDWVSEAYNDTNKRIKDEITTPVSELGSNLLSMFKEHTKNARNSTKGKHQKGQTRRKKDNFGEKGDVRRNPNPNKRRENLELVEITGYALIGIGSVASIIIVANDITGVGVVDDPALILTTGIIVIGLNLIIIKENKLRRENMINELIKIKEKIKIASIYINNDDITKFMVGYVIGVDDKWFILSCISPTGIYDGLIIDQVNKVLRINLDSKYEKKISLLEQENNQKSEIFTFGEDNIILEFLNFAKINKHFISIEIENSGYYELQGHINTINDDIIIIDEISEYGENDGNSIIKICSITKMRINSEDEKLLKKLNEISF